MKKYLALIGENRGWILRRFFENRQKVCRIFWIDNGFIVNLRLRFRSGRNLRLWYMTLYMQLISLPRRWVTWWLLKRRRSAFKRFWGLLGNSTVVIPPDYASVHVKHDILNTTGLCQLPMTSRWESFCAMGRPSPCSLRYTHVVTLDTCVELSLKSANRTVCVIRDSMILLCRWQTWAFKLYFRQLWHVVNVGCKKKKSENTSLRDQAATILSLESTASFIVWKVWEVLYLRKVEIKRIW